MTSKKILFTGGNGFIGRQIIPFLERDGHLVIRPRSTQVRLEVDKEVATLFENGQQYDAIIHGAIVGGRRDTDDSAKVLEINLRMFETLYKYATRSTSKFINLDSGASYGRPSSVPEPTTKNFGDVIPRDPYGLSKYIIAKRVLSSSIGVNLRVFGCFGTHEEPSRFFNTNINNYINHRPIRLLKDRKIDFIYANDLYKIVKYHLDDNYAPVDMNCVYSEKYMLSDIAKIINRMGDHEVDVIMEGQYPEFPYCGKSHTLPIKYDGLEKGIRECYETYLCQRNV